ncbi:MAG: response regulator transcription factor [Bacteroidia bacterium]|nr:response regulator transcription factor [Bacteroidia bacterium]
MPITISIIEDEKQVSDVLAILINGTPGYSCLKVYATAEDAIINIPFLIPDVVLVDIHLPDQSGIECVLKLKPICPQTQFVMCTSLENSEKIFDSLRAGASGYITKSTPPAKLLEAISDVYNGGSPMSSNIARKVASYFHTINQTSLSSVKLSSRENEILLLLSKGFRYKEIAEALYISIETVRTHIRNIYEKLNVSSRTEAINKMYPRK